ncbi:class I SAM-dependent methyltransferase [Pedobacter duraquae]|uniref:Methyltransferase family protein n=1 Tax=Pedobacter duraquae TaxID=425511 RepID=A0A4R6IG18_9SPHI|nr:class I SAM-dependent methyltransferase [Pedobacter duraquae]TDO20597.1 methyltransferase family protein [Pedobacter duraquae]
MDTYKETFETWNTVAALYEEKFMDLDFYNETYDYICSSIVKPNAKLLDLGCGPGNITKYLLSKRPDFDIYGIDVAPNMIELAKKNNPSARFDVMDSRQISQMQMKYDGIICGFCLPYLSPADSQKLILDVKDLLNDDGLFYLSFVEGDASQSGFQVGSSGKRVYFYYHTLAVLKMNLLEAGFENIEVFQIDYKKSPTAREIHTVLVARKK